MRTKQIAKGVNLGATASGTAVDMTGEDFPFQPGGSAVAVVSLANQTTVGSSTLALQGSDNGTSGWTDLVKAGPGVANGPLVAANITIPAFLRWNSVVGSSGTGRGSIVLYQN